MKTPTMTKSDTVRQYFPPYFYDGDGLRVSRKDNISNLTTYYVWDTENPTGYPQVVEEIENNQVVRRYGYGLFLENVDIWNGSAFDRFYVVRDGTNSVRMLLDSVGNAAAEYDYDAFGNVLNSTNANPITTSSPFGFHSEYKDPTTGLVYLRTRWYDSRDGRFVGMDKYEGRQESPNTLNKYVSFNNNPVNMTDPSGFIGIGEVSLNFDMQAVLSYNAKIYYTASPLQTTARILYNGHQVLWIEKRREEEERVVYAFSASSGYRYDLENYQYASLQDKPMGPIPSGKYSINLIPDPYRVAPEVDLDEGTFLKRSKEGGIEQIPPDYPAWGNMRARLDPMSGTNTYDREKTGDFYIHDSHKGYTHGCIETSSGIFDLLINYRMNKKNIGVSVKYSNPTTYGGSDLQ